MQVNLHIQWRVSLQVYIALWSHNGSNLYPDGAAVLLGVVEMLGLRHVCTVRCFPCCLYPYWSENDFMNPASSRPPYSMHLSTCACSLWYADATLYALDTKYQMGVSVSAPTCIFVSCLPACCVRGQPTVQQYYRTLERYREICIGGIESSSKNSTRTYIDTHVLAIRQPLIQNTVPYVSWDISVQ